MPNPYPLLYRIGMTPWDTQTDRGPITEILLNRPQSNFGSMHISFTFPGAGTCPPYNVQAGPVGA